MGKALHLMTDTVTIASISSVSGSGDASYGTQSTISARVEHKQDLIIDASGEEVMANHIVYSEDEIKLTDRVWLPGDATATADAARRPISIGKMSTPDGYTLYETRM